MKASKAVRSVMSWRGALGLLLCLTGAVACVWQIAEACTSSIFLSVYIQGNGSVHVQGTGVNGDATNAIPNPDSFACALNSTVTLTATPDTGYRFDHWEISATGSTNPAYVTMNMNKSVRAVFVQTTYYQLSISVTGSGSVALSPAAYNNLYSPGTVVTMTAMPATGWYFDHWEGSKTGSANPGAITMNANKSVTAVFRQREYTLTTSYTSGGSVTPWGTNTYPEGTSVTVTAEPMFNHRFVSWSGDLSGSTNPASVVMNANKSVTANFIGQAQLIVIVEGPGTVTPPSGTYDLGATLSMVATPSAGARFVGWSGDLTGTTSPVPLVMNGTKCVTARFSQQYTLTMAVEGEGTVSPEVGVHTYDSGTRVPLTATPAPGWRFSLWRDIPRTSTSVTMDANKKATAVFVRRFTLTTSAQNGGTVSPGPGATSYDEGTRVDITATPEPPFVFSGWEGDLTGSTNPAWVTMSGDWDVTATFAIPMRTLTVRLSPGVGAIRFSPGGASKPSGEFGVGEVAVDTFPMGSSVTVTAIPVEGYGLEYWNGALAGQGNPGTVIMDANKIAVGVMERTQYNLTMSVQPEGAGTTDPPVGTSVQAAGSTVTATASPEAGYRFARWTGDSASSEPSTSVVMTTDRSLTANFIGEGEVILTADYEGEGSVSPTYATFAPGQMATVTATPAEGWHFGYWHGVPIDGSHDDTETFPMWTDYHVHAVFFPNRTDEYYLEVKKAGSGTASPESGWHSSGEVVDVQAAASSGFRFAGWGGDGVTQENGTRRVVMDDDKSVTAGFCEEDLFQLRLRAEGPGRFNVSPPGPMYTPGTPVTITAVPNPNCVFEWWKGDFECEGLFCKLESEITVVMNSDKDITGYFGEHGDESTPNDDLLDPKEDACINKGLPKPDTDPILPATGTAYLEVEDLRIKGRGFDFVWKRTYRSRGGADTPMGYNWDFSYNAKVTRPSDATTGESLVVADGGGRRELFTYNGIHRAWVGVRNIRELTRALDYSYTLRHPDGTTWSFNRFGGPAPGRLRSIVDRNGNTMTFNYDIDERLSSVVDTLGRTITIEYDSEGEHVARVSDATGLRLAYSYEKAQGHEHADLKLAGLCENQGPGRVTEYTYTSGFNDDRLNHNLLTIVTPNGSQYVSNVYSDATDSGNVSFDRVVRQTWGDGDTKFVYLSQVPSEENHNASIKAIVNDGVGVVREYSYNNKFQLVLYRAFTGHADPDAPTTETANRPTFKMRDTDPDCHEEFFTYNAQGLLSSKTVRNRDVVEPACRWEYTYLGDVRPTVRLVSSGNLVSTRKGTGSQTPSLIVEYTYPELVQTYGCDGCGTYALSETDAEGKVTNYYYDEHGNRLGATQAATGASDNYEYNQYGQVTAHILPDNGGHRRRDEYTYYASGFGMGYLQSITVDAGGENLTAQFTYDARGNITSVTDPKGGTTNFAYNAFDEVSQVTSRALADGVRYHKNFQYDGNGNLTAAAVEEVGGWNGTSDGWLLTQYEYNAQNQTTAVVHEISDTEQARTEFIYDGNRRLMKIRTPEASAGRQTNNVREIIYDEFDRIMQTLDGAGESDGVCTQFDYDDENRIVRRTVDVAHSPRVYNYFYDGNGHLQTTVDPLGNRLETQFSAGGKLQSASVLENNGTVLLSQVDYHYDAAGRPDRVSRQHFNPITHSPVGDGISETQYQYNADSTLSSIINDRGFATQYIYDTVNRLSAAVDALGNRVDYTYDVNSNVTQLAETYKADPAVGGEDKVFYTSYEYDALDRLAVKHDGHYVYGYYQKTPTYTYDSRDNLVEIVTHLASGRISRYAYDGLGRLVKRWAVGGEASGGPLEDVGNEYGYDTNSRVIWVRDANNQETHYTYDHLDRLTAVAYADGTQKTFTFDDEERSVTSTDAAGTEVVSVYDLLGRLESRTFTAAPGVSSDTTLQTFQYDALSRPIFAEDDDSTVTFDYDSLSNPIRESFNGRTLTRNFDGQGNSIQTVYPGGTMFNRTFDALNRLGTVTRSDVAQPLATYRYFGPDKVRRRDNANGTRLDITPEWGFSGSSWVKYTKTSDSSVLSNVLLRFDASGNKDRETGDGDYDAQNLFTYDRLGRLKYFSTNSPDNQSLAVNYTYDGANNRLSATGSVLPGAYTLDPVAPEPNDASVHQYTATPFDTRAYDATGALVTKNRTDRLSDATLTYDALGQLVRYEDTSMPQLFADDFNDGDYAGWTVEYGNFNVVDGALEFGLGYFGFPTAYRSLGEADSDVSVSYRLLDVYSDLDVVSRYYYNSSTDCGSLSLTVKSDRIYLTERVNGLLTAQTSDVLRTSEMGQTYRLRMLSEGPRVRVWRTVTGQAPELLFDITTQVLTTTQFRLVSPSSTTAVDDVRVLGGPVDTTVEFAYDALGRRIGKSVEKSTGAAYDMRYTYDGWRLAEWGTANGAVLADYAYGNGLDELLHTHWYGFESDFYSLQDDQGSVLALTDASGTVVERYGYGPGGEPTAYSPQGQPLGYGGTSAQLFAGREYDLETGLYYSRYRYYDPEAGRFITRDPLGAWADPTALGNPFAYCGNSPWDTVDPFGLWAADPLDDNQAWRDQVFGGGTTRAGGLVGPSIPLGHFARDLADILYVGGEGFMGFAEQAGLGTLAATDALLQSYFGDGARPFQGFYDPCDEHIRTTRAGTNLALLPLRTYGAVRDIASSTIRVGWNIGARQGPSVSSIAHGLTELERKIPNQYGRRGGPAHVARVKERAEELIQEGHALVAGGTKPERAVTIPSKDRYRFPDIETVDPSGRAYYENIGRATGKGEPISRERQAIEDLTAAMEGRPAGFTPYKP